MNKVSIYCEKASNGFQYVLDFIASQFKELEFIVIHSKEDYLNSKLPKINYSNLRILEPELFIQNREFFNSIHEIPFPSITYLNHQCVLFPSVVEDDLGFDIFTAIFWMLTNYEERSNLNRDQHGRFLAQYSCLYENKEFTNPLVDQWVNIFIDKINIKYGTKFIRTSQFRWSIGIDVDQAWKYKHKSSWNQFGGMAKSLLSFNFKEFKNRYNTILLDTQDPFDTYKYLDSFNLLKEQLIFFILSKTNNELDATHSIQFKSYTHLLQDLKTKYFIGLHPSYDSKNDVKLIKSQKSELEEILRKSVTMSRQHFLRLQNPETYRHLISLGFEKDYSICYADHSGFRTGTCHPYHFFDVEANQVSSLIIQPVQAMDRTYLQQMKYSPAETIQNIETLIHDCKKFQGQFHLIWHNSSFDYQAEWKGWEGVFDEIISLLKLSTKTDLTAI
ncbi:MAG: polysaccharide deacetylase family protein [Saprospiraceae bacterium]